MPSNHLPTTYQEFIHLSRYSRWMPEEKRRETWGETVSRYFDYFTDHLQELHKYKISDKLRHELETSVLGLKVTPKNVIFLFLILFFKIFETLDNNNFDLF